MVFNDGADPVATDPRPPGPDPREVGRGALPPAAGRFLGLRLTRSGVRLEYLAGAAAVQERMTAADEAGKPVLVRWFRVAPSAQPLLLVLTRQAPSAESPFHVAAALAGGGGAAALAELSARSGL